MSGPFGEEHPLADALVSAAEGRFPPADGVVELVGADAAGTEAVVEFTAHTFVLTDWPGAAGVLAGRDAFGGATAVDAIAALVGPGGSAGSLDMVLVRRAGVAVPDPLGPTDRYDDHPRVVRSRSHRRDVRVYGDDDGLVTVGRGIVGRTEVSVELTGSSPAGGVGRRLVERALSHLPADEWVFAQVAPGNAASVRAFLALGFRPIGSEILLHRAGR